MEPDTSVDSAAHVELLAAIAWALSEISNQDVGALPSEGELTVFHASGQSVISILDYVMRIASFINCSFECYVVAVIFLDRLLTANPHIRFGPYTAHRLIITAVVLAVKSIDDEYYRNSFYANVGGIPTHELNRMEVEFLVAMQYNLYVGEKEFVAYRDRLRWCMIEPTISADGSTSRSPLTASPQGWPRAACGGSGDCGFPPPAKEISSDGIAVDGAGSLDHLQEGQVLSHVAAAVSVIDSPPFRQFDEVLRYGATEDATRRTPSATPSGGGSALRAWVEAGCTPAPAALPTLTGPLQGYTSQTEGTETLTWADGAWPSWDAWSGGQHDPWAFGPADDAQNAATQASARAHVLPRTADAEAARECGFDPALPVPADLAIPFPEPAPAVGVKPMVGDVSRLRRCSDADGQMRAGYSRDFDVYDWGVGAHGVLGVIAA